MQVFFRNSFFWRRNRRRVPTAIRVRIVARLFAQLIRVGRPLLAPILLVFALHQLYTLTLRSPFFSLREIRVSANSSLSKMQILHIAGIKRGQNLLSIDLKKANQRLQAHPQVAHVRVRRELPHRLVVKIETHRPAAILQLDQPYLVNRDGKIFARLSPQDHHPSLLRIRGLQRSDIEEDPAAFRLLFQQALAVRRLYYHLGLSSFQALREIQIDWTLGYILHGEHTKIYLGHDAFEQRLQRIQQVSMYLAQQGVRKLQTIYANHQRHPQRITLRLADAIALATPQPKKPTHP
jgi:cell division protein FtsQ